MTLLAEEDGTHDDDENGEYDDKDYDNGVFKWKNIGVYGLHVSLVSGSCLRNCILSLTI